MEIFRFEVVGQTFTYTPSRPLKKDIGGPGGSNSPGGGVRGGSAQDPTDEAGRRAPERPPLQAEAGEAGARRQENRRPDPTTNENPQPPC
jgi:hypothetical protein